MEVFIAENVMTALKVAVGTALGREVSSDEAVYCCSGTGGETTVEVADVRFIRDGERLRVGRRKASWDRRASCGPERKSRGSAKSRYCCSRTYELKLTRGQFTTIKTCR